MSKREILAGATDQTVDVFIQDSSATDGSGLTGLAFNTSGLTCYYRKGATGTPTALSLATQTVGGAHSDGGFVAVDGTNCPGQYRLDLSDTIVATAGMVTLYLKGATNMAPCLLEIEVVSVNKFDSVRMGLTALPNAAADAAGGLPISDAGGLDLDAMSASVAATEGYVDTEVAAILAAVDTEVAAILADTNELQGDWTNGGRLDLIIDAILADTNEMQGDLADGGRLDLLIDAILADTNELQSDDYPTRFDTVDSSLSTITGYIDTEVAAILAAVDTEVAAILADTNELQGDWTNGGRLDLLLDAIKVVTDALTSAAAAKLALSAATIVSGTVSNAVLTPTTTAFAADDITEATADHYIGRIIIFTSGALQYQATDITDYSLVSSEGNFTVTTMTEAPANDDTFIII